ncbi:MAG: hypothetical protein G8345_08100 [Magnetococcales bacterium]|nr:hypothetical protein [Magnetococcales bacterium]NGZ26836.1 hypothetical protein [Magnetococcales bacterium]
MTMSTDGNPKSKLVFSQLAEEADGLGKRIEKYVQMERDLQTLPLPRDDFAQQLAQWVDLEAERYIPMLAQEVSPLVEQPYFDPAKAEIHLLAKDENGQIDVDRMQAMVAYLFRDQLKEAMQQAVAGLKWPRKVGPPRMRRDQMIASIHAKLESLQSREGELMAVARDLLRKLEKDRDSAEMPKPLEMAKPMTNQESRVVTPVIEAMPEDSDLTDEEKILLESLQGDRVVELPGLRKTGTG